MQCRSIAVCGVLTLLLGVFSCGSLALGAEKAADKLPADAMAGQVVDPAGKPIAAATVWLVGGPYEEDAKTLDKTKTDAQGHFVLLQAKAKWNRRQERQPELVARDGQARLGAEPMPWAWGFGAFTPRQDVRIKLVEVEDCPGRLLDTAGKPIAKARVRPRSFASVPLDDPGRRGVMLPPELAEEMATETDAEGRFTLQRVPKGGSVGTRVTAAGFGKPGVTWDVRPPVVLRLDRAGDVRGVVKAPPGVTGLDTLRLSLYVGTDAEKAKRAGCRVGDSAEMRPGKDGRFQASGISPGTGQIHVGLHDSSLPYYCKPSIPIVVKPGETTAVEVQLLPAVAVRGQVIEALSGKGVAGVNIMANRISDQGYMVSNRRTTTDAEGRFVVYAEPGKVVVYPGEVPDGYVIPRHEGQTLRIDASQDLTWPTIKLERAVRLEALVVDESGKPQSDAEVQFLVPRNGYDTSTQKTDRNGVCSLEGLSPREFVAVRARTETAVSDVAEIRPADAKGRLRLTVSPKKVFAIRGVCVDAAGRPIRGAKASIFTSWVLGSSGLGFGLTSCETDAEGRFEARPLWPGGQYHVSVTAEGFDKFESKSFRAQPGEVHDVGRLALVATGGAVQGIVVDSAGKPIAGARVFNSGDAPKLLSTHTDAAGRFRLEGFRTGPVCVFAEKAGYRFTGVWTEAQRADAKIALRRSDEPLAPWKPQRPPLTLEQGQKVARRLLEKFWATPPHGREHWTIESMARIDPQQALTWSAALAGRHDGLVRRVAAEEGRVEDAEEIVAFLAKQSDPLAYSILKSLAERYASSDPEKALRLAEEAIQRARRLDQPDRTYSLAMAGALVAQLGKPEPGKKLVEEAAEMAAKMGTDERRAYARGLVAAAIAPFDLARAMSLVEPVDKGYERERALARIATSIASKDLKRALEIIGRLDKNSTLADMARLRIAYDLVAARREDALRVVEGMDTHGATKTKAEALGWMATAVAAHDRQFAHALIDKSMAIYGAKADEFRGWSNYGGRAAFAAFVVSQAHQIGYPDMELLINRVLAMRPTGEDEWSPQENERAVTLTAGILAMVDPECAKRLLLTVSPQQPGPKEAASVMENLDLFQAWALIDPAYTVSLIGSQVDAANGGNFWTNYLIQTLELLTTPPDRRGQVLLRYSGARWFPGEDL